MDKRIAKKLHNGDQVEVRIGPATWVLGTVLGEPAEVPGGIVVIPVLTQEEGLLSFHHRDVR